jgi:branched-chain amino acid transport system permease protein
MSQFVTLFVSGLSLGCMYALIALGFVIVFKATRVVNFAYGSLVLLGAYTIARTHTSLGFLGAVAAGVAVTAVGGVLIDLVFVRRVRHADLGTLAILTLGVDILMGTELTRRIHTDLLTIGDPWGTAVVSLGSGISVPQTRISAAVVAVVLIGAFLAALKFTDWGIAMRAAAERSETATLMGIRLNRIAAGAWALAGALAATAGLFLTTFPSPGVTAGIGLTALGAAVPAAVLGGLDSTTGALVGGLVVGVAATLTAGYQDQLAFLGRGLGEVVPYVVMLLVLLVRPSGLFGTKEITRV